VSSAPSLHRVLIADRQLLFRRGLRALFSSTDDLAVAVEASEISEALEAARSTPQLSVVMVSTALIEDLSEPALGALRRLAEAMPVLLLAGPDSPHPIELLLHTGALGYLLRTSSPVEILSAVRRACQGEKTQSTDMAKTVADLRALATSTDTYSHAAAATLTPREQDVLRLLAQGYTVRQSAAELALSMKTVDAHKLNLMRKLDIHNRATLIEYAIASGVIEAPAA
jgi:two-component system, NarL family, response regulator NreC